MSRALPQTEPDPSLPPRVHVYEVGPRDGLQNEDAVVPVEHTDPGRDEAGHETVIVRHPRVPQILDPSPPDAPITGGFSTDPVAAAPP